MMPSNTCACIHMCKAERSFSYANQTMLTLSMLYPQITLRNNPLAQRNINCRIQAQVDSFYKYASEYLYQQAISAYKYAQENGFPFHHYEAVLQYEVTYNSNCHLSLYYDQYEFTGGAHGSTIRASDTYGLLNGCTLPLSSFLPADKDYCALLLEQIMKQAQARMQQEPGIFFEDYPCLILEHFNDESFYLTPCGIAVYFQQYEIAPYATGIVVFTIPYEVLQWWPQCCLPSRSNHRLC
jgi:hypothetical protein